MRRLSGFFLFCLVFLFIFGPILDSPLGAFGDVSFLVALTTLLFFPLKIVPLELQRLLSIPIFILFLATLTLTLFDIDVAAVGVRAVLRPVKAIVNIAAAWVIAAVLCQRWVKGDKYILVKIVYWCLVVHGAIMIAQFVSPDFKSLVYTFTTAKYQLDHYQEFRMAGLSSGGGAQLSFTQSLGFALFLFLVRVERGFKFPVYGIGALIILASVFFSGRTGFVFVALALAVFLVLPDQGRSLFKLKIVLSVSLLAVLISSVGINLENEYMQVAFRRNFETILNFIEFGSFQDNTLIALGKMVIIPEGVLHFLFGRPSYLENNTFYNIYTDIGYFRLIWGYGVVGLGIHIFFYAYAFHVIRKHRVWDRELSVLLIILTVFIFIFNYKEIAFFSKMSFQVYLVLLMKLIYQSTNKAVKSS